MGNSRAQFIVGADGRRRAVLLGVTQYRRLLRRIEDLEDAVALDRAEGASKKLLRYDKVRERLKRAGKL